MPRTPLNRPPHRVLRVIARLNIGGPALHVMLLDSQLDRARYACWLVAGRESAAEGSLREVVRERGVRVLDLPWLARELDPWRDLMALWRLIRMIRRVRPAIVHTHTAKAGTLGRLAALLCRVPIRIHTFHGHTFHGYFSARKTRVFAAIERWLARRTTRLIGVSRQVCEDLLALGIGTRETMLHIPLGLELDGLASDDARCGTLRGPLGIPADAPVVGVVARLVPIKRLDRFLRVAARVHAVLPEARFVLVGDGDQRAQVAGWIEALGLTGVAYLAGWRDDLGPVLADLDVVALTSDNEGLPVALIEAQAAARPVVATDVGGVRELVEDGVSGRVLATDDEAGMADALVALLSDRGACERMGQAARASALARYDHGRLVGDIDRLYAHLLADAGLA